MAIDTLGHVARLDPQSSEQRSPYIVITADCDNPKEIDDGLIVERLDVAAEAYRVGVCIVDASSLVSDEAVVAEAMKNIHAVYRRAPDGTELYEPMIDKSLIRDFEFTEGNVRDALILWFKIQKNRRPTDLQIEFGKVEIASNYSYNDLDRLYRTDDAYIRFGKAAGYILRGLGAPVSLEEDEDERIEHAPNIFFDRIHELREEKRWSRGAKMNAAFMVAANHLIGRHYADIGRPGIFRVHGSASRDDLDGAAMTASLANNTATYSLVPGVHQGLGLDPYMRATSPLRRLEDLWMLADIRQLYDGNEPTLRDTFMMGEVVRRLNWLVLNRANRIDGRRGRMPLVPSFEYGDLDVA